MPSSRGAPGRSAEANLEAAVDRELGGGDGPVKFRAVLSQISAKTDDVVDQPITVSAGPPINFGEVAPGLYRSGYPQAANYSFLQTLHLKTIVTLVEKEMPEGYQQFIDDNGINHQVFNMTGTKKEEIPASLMKSIAAVVLNSENYPLLIHCNHGKHRTGCVVGVIRKQSAWDVNAIIREYSDYAAPKIRTTDIDYIRNFQISEIASIKSLLSSKLSKARSAVTGTFLSFVFFTLFTLCICVSTGSKLLTIAPPRRDTGGP
ncbi:tyrosine-protein phosphatase siw14 [Diatrype stigma]|uniref:diphosphoinositol-polyphosphate diphosphatase n=1 Tax=Diatrype stigma TaxID=117547 RepID=A0AAN9UTQ2_9PEZI